MKTFAEIENSLREIKEEIIDIYHISEISLFGSYVRNEATENSDLDILVEFSKPINLFKFIELEESLTKKIGLKVDLVSKKALKPKIGERILKEAIAV